MTGPKQVTDPNTVRRIDDLLGDAQAAAIEAWLDWPASPNAQHTNQQRSMEHAVRARDLLAEAILARTAALNTGT